MNKRVLIDVHSDSMGDIVSLVPYVEKFREDTGDTIFLKIQQQYIFFFEGAYPNINFVRGKDSLEYDKSISLSYDWDLLHDRGVQSNFASQLGYSDCPYIRPVIKFTPGERPIKNKYVTIGIHSTAQLKYWNHPLGKKVQIDSPYWDDLCGMIRREGYTPVVVERDELFGDKNSFNGLPKKSNKKFGQNLNESMNLIYHSEFYLGLSSGMSWVAHAMGKPVAMISNFTEDWNEFDLSAPDYKRITNKSVCHGCWNRINKEFKFDTDDWYWCPRHKNTDRQFECHTSITPEMVFNEIKGWLPTINK